MYIWSFRIRILCMLKATYSTTASKTSYPWCFIYLFIPMYTLCAWPQKSFMIIRASVWSISEQIWNIWCSYISSRRGIKNTLTSSFSFALSLTRLARKEELLQCMMKVCWCTSRQIPSVWFHEKGGTSPPGN